MTAIRIVLRLFGPAAEWVGRGTLEYSVDAPATLDGLIRSLAAQYPQLESKAGFVRFAVNGEYASTAQELKEGDEVAIIPPVAGGDAEYIRLTREVINADMLSAMVESIKKDSCGGLVTFEGVVREEGTAENPLAALEYSAYEEMALSLLRRLREQARSRFEIHDAAIVHRLGRLAIGECSVAIMVAAPHRAAAFDACRWIMEEIKKDAPIWKKEIWRSGEQSWV